MLVPLGPRCGTRHGCGRASVPEGEEAVANTAPTDAQRRCRFDIEFALQEGTTYNS